MKRFLIIMCMLSACIGYAKANEIVVTNVLIPKGGTTTLDIQLNNEQELKPVFEFYLRLPEGISVVENSEQLGNRFSGTQVNLTCNYVETENRYWIIAMIPPTVSADVPIPGENGTLVTVNLQASDAIEVGTILNGSIEDIEFGTWYKDSSGEILNLQSVNFSITIGQPADPHVILDENSTSAPVSATNVDVRVFRTINANEWSTIVLPFAMTETQVKAAFGDDVQLADFTGYDVTEAGEDIVGITVGFDDVTAIEANHPYIIKVVTAVTEFTVNGVNVEPIDAPCVAFGREYGRPKKYHPMDFVGTYVADFNFFNDAQSGYAIFLNGGKFYYATASTGHMKAFRAYFDFDDILTDVEQAANVIEFKINSDDDATGLKNLNDLLGSNVPAYNLSGQRVGKNYKGIVVTKGKKAVK